MAKVTGPLFSVEGTGKLGEGICFTRSLGGARVILNPTHKDAYSALQSVHRSSFITGKSMWKALSAVSKAYYNTLAADLKMTGYNLYIKKVLLGQVGAVVWVNDSVAITLSGYNDDTAVGYSGGSWFIDNLSPYGWLGNTSIGVNKSGQGLRFLAVTIPVGAIILTAHLHLTCALSDTAANCYGRIVGNLQTNPAGWTTLADFQARRGTDAGGGDNTKRTVLDVPWHVPTAMTLDVEYETPDITPIIQELVSQAGYTSGNPMVLWVDDYKGESTQEDSYFFWQKNAGVGKTARLHVTYKYIA